MNLFWKIFFSVLIITYACFGIFGYILIDSNFTNSLDNVKESSLVENQIVLSTLQSDYIDAYNNFLIQDHSNDNNDNYEKELLMSIMSESSTLKTSEGNISFNILDHTGRSLNDSSNEFLVNKDKILSYHEVIYTDSGNSNRYLKLIYPFKINDSVFYLTTWHNIENIFEEREYLLKIFCYAELVILIVLTLILFVLSYFLTNPIKKLKTALQKMTEGDYSEILDIKSDDEIAALTNSYNIMSKKINETVDLLKEKNEKKEDFISSFAHEIKTPLTSMIGYADMLRLRKTTEEEKITWANYIYIEGKRLEAISKKLLDLLVLDNTNAELTSIESVEYFEEIIGTSRPFADKKKIAIVSNIEDFIFTSDDDLLKTVCINIIDNACKSMSDNGKLIISATCLSDDVLITFKDDGIGIDADKLKYITEPFFVVEKSRNKKLGGVGLGLSICKKILTLLNGDMTFDSEKNKGTTVTLRLREACKNEKENQN